MVQPPSASPPRGPAARIIDTTAVAVTSAFAGGALLTQTVIVPHWREMDPAEFLSEFASSGPATGATVFPFEVASVVLLGMTTYSTVTRRQPGRLVSMELDTHGTGPCRSRPLVHCTHCRPTWKRHLIEITSVNVGSHEDPPAEGQ